MASIELQVITVQGARRVNSGVASSFLYPFPRRPPRHFLYLRSFCLRHPLFPRFCSLSLFLSLARFHPLWPPSAAFLADKLDSIIANHDGRDDSHVADRPASWQRKGEVEMSPSFGSTSRWSVTVARSLTPRRVQHEKKSISWILLSLPMCAATSVGIHSSELITAPAARRIVITLPTPCTPLLVFSPLTDGLPLLTRGQVTHYLDIVSFAVRHKRESFFFLVAGILGSS